MALDIKVLFSTRNNRISTFLVVATILIIAFLFPRSPRFQLEYEKGNVWSHETLLAPFEFRLIESEQSRIEKRNRLMISYIPSFRKTQWFGKVDNDIFNYFESRKEHFTSDQFSKVASLLEFKRNKPFVSKDQLIIDGVQKNTFILGDNEENVYDDEKFIYINSFYNDLSALIPEDDIKGVGSLLKYEVEYDDITTKRRVNSSGNNVFLTDEDIKKGELVVAQGNLITNDIYNKLQSLEYAFSNKKLNFIESIGSFFGYMLLTFLIIGALIVYLFFHFPQILKSPKELGFILLWIVLFPFLIVQIERNLGLSAYIIPFCIAPLVIKTYYEDRLALFVHLVIVLIASFISHLGYEFTFLQILAGVVTVLFIEETRYMDRFLWSVLIIFFTYFLGFLGLSMVNTNQLIGSIDPQVFVWLIVNGVLMLLAYPFIPLFSKVFNFTSSIVLKELAEINKPLLKRLSLEAPGTFQHSLQVSNLAEGAAESIGADSLLVKVAALYHDIGKLNEPEYFIENQHGTNPHDDLSPMESAKKIIAHVSEGVKMAKKENLPSEIIKMIKTHHGNSRTEYFYKKHLSDQPNGIDDDTPFRYEGPCPVSKEETILMLADSIEAACKSLKNPTGEDIDKFIDSIVQYKIKNDQLIYSKITFEELLQIEKIFKEMMRSIHHVRIEYPKEKTEESFSKV